jgi:hypothetical protein
MKLEDSPAITDSRPWHIFLAEGRISQGVPVRSYSAPHGGRPALVSRTTFRRQSPSAVPFTSDAAIGRPKVQINPGILSPGFAGLIMLRACL